MPWFRCVVIGENFPLEVNGMARAMGFTTVRVVEAVDTKAAEAEAIAALQGEPLLQAAATQPGSERARIIFDEIVEVGGRQTGTGFAFFPMEE